LHDWNNGHGYFFNGLGDIIAALGEISGVGYEKILFGIYGRTPDVCGAHYCGITYEMVLSIRECHA
jgi:hypothetical protein